MIAYFDTSAFLPLFIREPGTDRCRKLWDAAERIVVTRLVHVEASAALAQATRMGRLDSVELEDALHRMDAVWHRCHVRELDEQLMLNAGRLAREHSLRGYDAVHCAAAVELRGEESAAASGDRSLLQAWSALGVTTMDPNGAENPP